MPTLPADIPGVGGADVVGVVEVVVFGVVVGATLLGGGGATEVVGIRRLVVAGTFCVLDFGLVSSV